MKLLLLLTLLSCIPPDPVFSSTARSPGMVRAVRHEQRLISRADEAILEEVRRILRAREETARWGATVRKGGVTIRTTVGNKFDPGPVVAAIRRIAGVETVLLIVP